MLNVLLILTVFLYINYIHISPTAPHLLTLSKMSILTNNNVECEKTQRHGSLLPVND